MDGYQGYIISSDLDDLDWAIYIKFWDSEEAMVKSMNNLDEDSQQIGLTEPGSRDRGVLQGG
jgi:hypothetical protein